MGLFAKIFKKKDRCKLCGKPAIRAIAKNHEEQACFCKECILSGEVAKKSNKQIKKPLNRFTKKFLKNPNP